MERRQFLQQSAFTTALATQFNSSFAVTPRDDNVATLTANLNPRIQHARDVALNILKPSDSELQRGLQLHAESIVFDSYSFSPRAAVDGDALAAASAAGASAAELKDLRESMTMTRYVSDPAEQSVYLEAWRASGVTCVFQNAGEEGQDPIRLIKRLSNFTSATDMMKQFVMKAAVPDDVIEAKQQGKHCLYFTGNRIPLTQQWV
jgi:membrane dipeptidase